MAGPKFGQPEFGKQMRTLGDGTSTLIVFSGMVEVSSAASGGQQRHRFESPSRDPFGRTPKPCLPCEVGRRVRKRAIVDAAGGAACGLAGVRHLGKGEGSNIRPSIGARGSETRGREPALLAVILAVELMPGVQGRSASARDGERGRLGPVALGHGQDVVALPSRGRSMRLASVTPLARPSRGRSPLVLPWAASVCRAPRRADPAHPCSARTCRGPSGAAGGAADGLPGDRHLGGRPPPRRLCEALPRAADGAGGAGAAVVLGLALEVRPGRPLRAPRPRCAVRAHGAAAAGPTAWRRGRGWSWALLETAIGGGGGWDRDGAGLEKSHG